MPKTGYVVFPNTVYYGARYYDPELSRFTQADTVVPSAGDPQMLNRYSYAANNPLKYVDPSGHFIIYAIAAIVVLTVAVVAVALLVIGIANLVTGNNYGTRIFGSEIGFWVDTAAAITTVIALAALATFLAPEALPFIIASGVLSIGSIAAGAAGNPELAAALGWAALAVAVAGTIYEIATLPDPPAAGGSASDKLGTSASSTEASSVSKGDQSPPGRTPSKDEVLSLRGEGKRGALPRHEKIAADKIGVLGGDDPKRNCLGLALDRESNQFYSKVPDLHKKLTSEGFTNFGTNVPTTKTKIAVYSLDLAGAERPTHVARHLKGEWWESKLGPGPHISHRLGTLEDKTFGRVIRYYGK